MDVSRRVTSRAWRSVVAVGLMAAAALPGLLFLADPPGRDQGVFAYIGWRWLEGEVPYAAGGVEHKGPLPFAAYALATSLFGHSFASIRLLAWAAVLVAAAGVAWIGGQVRGRSVLAGGASGGAYLLAAALSGLSAYWFGAQAETFMEPFVVGAAALALAAAGREREGSTDRAGTANPLWMAAGFVLGLATLGKPTAVLMAPVLLLVAHGWWRPGRAVQVAAGLALPWLATASYFMLRGAGAEFVDNVFVMNLAYGGEGVSQVPHMLSALPAAQDRILDLRLLVLAGAGVVAAIVRLVRLGSAGADRAARLLLAWAAAAYAEVLLQGRLWPYHFWPTLAPVALLGVYGLRAAAGAVARARTPLAWRAAAGATLIAGLAGGAGLDWRELDLRLRHLGGDLTQAAFLRHFSPRGNEDVDPTETLAAAAYVAANLDADETLLIWGFEPAVNFLARRRSATRYLGDYYLDSPVLPEAVRTRYWRVFWEEMAARPPGLVAVVHRDVDPIEDEDSAAQLASTPLAPYLAVHYRPEIRIGDFELLRRASARDAAAAAASREAGRTDAGHLSPLGD